MPAKRGPRTTWSPRAENAVQLKVTLKYIKPPIWRRLLLPDNYTLGDLHGAIQIAMGWGNYHLHAFRIGGIEYTSEEANLDELEMEDEDTVLLKTVTKRPKQKFTYEYDFGDSWQHEIVVEKIPPLDPQGKYPVCVAGARACPPEDCGSVPGYYGILEAIGDPDNPEHKELLEWLGGSYDPEHFDLDAVNRRLRGKA